METATADKITIRVAQPNDLPEVFRLVDSVDSEEFIFEINRDKLKNSLRELIYVRGALFGECNGQVIGGVAGYALPCMFTDEMLYCCMFLYVKKEFRHLTKKFIQELELTLLPTNAKRLTFGVPEGQSSDLMQRFFKMMGYKKLETHYYKRF